MVNYGRRWKKCRKIFLQANPLCSRCYKIGKLVEASIVDHIIPHKGDEQLFWDQSNWQALCKPCHDGHKKRFETSGRIAGCNQSGIPTDPRHHWNRPK